MSEFNTEIKKLLFKEYYSALTEEERINLREFFVPKYMTYRTYYNRLADNNWSEYDFEKLEELTHINFR